MSYRNSPLFISAQQKTAELISLHFPHIDTSDWQKFTPIEPLVNAIMLSDFVAQQLETHPTLFSHWWNRLPSFADCDHYALRVAQCLASVEDEITLYQVLRTFRHQEMAKLSFCQSNQLASVNDIFIRLSELAEALIIGARDWLFAQLSQEYGVPTNDLGEKQTLFILGMGKLGGKELNFSSDIDLIFTYPEQGYTVGGKRSIENSKFFTRLGQKLISALDQQTAEGFVYRTDMRLRPFGDSGALVFSFAAMEDYYQEQGRDWERYAFVKARILNEDKNDKNCCYLKQLLRPFVYRRYLDFSAIQSLREMKDKISREVVRRNLVNNIKLGAGGIREIEFIVQTFQLIRGGRNKILQQQSLLQVLPQLELLHLLTHQQVIQLRQAYLFLRQIENVLQAIDDKQTQTLPENDTDCLRLIYACQRFIAEKDQIVAYPIENWHDFLQVLSQHQKAVRTIFNHLIGEETSSNDSNEKNEKIALWNDFLHQVNEEEFIQVLKEYPEISNPTALFHLLSAYLQEWSRRAIGIRGRNVLRQLLPKILDLLFNQADYAVLMPRILKIIDRITTRTTYLELLLEQPQVLPQLMCLCSQSVMLAEQIARYPMLLDELIIQKSLSQVMALESYAQSLHQYLLRIPEEDEEHLIDALRQFKQSQILHIAAADIFGLLPVMKISDHLTYLAEAIIGEVVNIAWKQLTQRFGTPDHLAPQSQGFAIIGYGKLGGIELGYNSDLDLVFLHNAPANGETIGGKRTISSHQFYLKLAQKINAIFSLNTSSGILYEVDMRLRPSGEAGLLVSTFEAFEYYQQQEAWTWESQALVRSRCVYGSDKLRKIFAQIRQNSLIQPRTSGQLQGEINQMREKMFHHLSKTPQGKFHLKTDRGGITDIEFIAQYLVLAYADSFPIMAKWSDNVRIFETAVSCGILSETVGEKLKNSYTTLRNSIHHLNLLGKECLVDETKFSVERQFIHTIWADLLPISSA